jgi:N-acyl homoserine lactone hydrolase
MGSQTNLIMTTDKILKAVNGEARRVPAPHEENMPNICPSRKSKEGLFVIEVALPSGELSAVTS